METIRKLEFMFMKHYAPIRCEPSVGADVNREVKFLCNFKFFFFFFFFFFWGGGGVRVDVNGEVKFL